MNRAIRFKFGIQIKHWPSSVRTINWIKWVIFDLFSHVTCKKTKKNSYCCLWRLNPSPMEIVASVFPFIYSTLVQPVSLGYTWRANNSGMTPIPYNLGWHWTGLWAIGNTLQRLPESYKAGIISWWNLLDPLGVPRITPWDHLRWLCVTLRQNTVAQCGNVPHMLAL